MAYYLTIKQNKEYKKLDISYLKEFQRLSKFKGDSYSLEELDNFTSMFKNEIELKRSLYNSGIISLDEITKEISIRRKNKNELIKVMYELYYESTRKYLDEYYLRSKLLELQNDKAFLNKLLAHYRSSHYQEPLAQIRALVMGYQDTDLNIYTALSNFFNNEIYSVDYTTGETKIKYKSLHDLGMFIINYLKQNINQKEEKQKELQILQEELTPKQTFVKKRVKTKRIELEGQTTFF